jgi:transcriptional regulator with XRE-family HTH domain
MALTQRNEKHQIPPFMIDIGSGSRENADLRDIVLGSDYQTSDKPAFSFPLVILVTTGTGGCLLPDKVRPVLNTGGLEALEIPTVFHVPSRSPRPISEKITAIKERLGLNVKQLSQVLGVQRPTVYQWLKGGEIRQSNRARVNDVFELSSDWTRHCQLPVGSLVSQDLEEGESLLELISKERLPHQAIRSAFEVLCPLVEEASVKAKQESLSDRLRAKGFSRPPKEVQDANVQEFFSEIALED